MKKNIFLLSVLLFTVLCHKAEGEEVEGHFFTMPKSSLIELLVQFKTQMGSDYSVILWESNNYSGTIFFQVGQGGVDKKASINVDLSLQSENLTIWVDNHFIFKETIQQYQAQDQAQELKDPKLEGLLKTANTIWAEEKSKKKVCRPPNDSTPESLESFWSNFFLDEAQQDQQWERPLNIKKLAQYMVRYCFTELQEKQGFNKLDQLGQWPKRFFPLIGILFSFFSLQSQQEDESLPRLLRPFKVLLGDKPSLSWLKDVRFVLQHQLSNVSEPFLQSEEFIDTNIGQAMARVSIDSQEKAYFSLGYLTNIFSVENKVCDVVEVSDEGSGCDE